MTKPLRYRHDGALGSTYHVPSLRRGDQDWTRACFVCGEKPTVFVATDDTAPLCGPCTFGEAATAGGNW
jgi:hypothetical protein